MTKPKSCQMPDLSELRSDLLLVHALNLVFRGAYVSNLKAKNYVVSYIRVVDKAMYEYNAAHDLLSSHVARGGIGDLLRASAHLETCINSTKRALNLVERMKRFQSAPPIDKSIERMLASYGRPIPELRHAIEHMDERIERDEIAAGGLIGLMVSEQGDAIAIADERISFHDLALVLRRLHALAEQLAAYRDSDQRKQADATA